METEDGFINSGSSGISDIGIVAFLLGTNAGHAAGPLGISTPSGTAAVVGECRFLIWPTFLKRLTRTAACIGLLTFLRMVFIKTCLFIPNKLFCNRVRVLGSSGSNIHLGWTKGLRCLHKLNNSGSQQAKEIEPGIYSAS